MIRSVSIRVIIALFTVAICTVCLAVFWIVIFATASSLARDQAHQVRVGHLQLVQSAVTQYFATAPNVATFVTSQLHRRFTNISYTNLFNVASGLVSAQYAHKLSAAGMAVRVPPRALKNNPNPSPPCNLDLAVVAPTGALIFANATNPTPVTAAISGPKNTNYTSPMQITRVVTPSVNATCSSYSWSVLCQRFRRDENRTIPAWGTVGSWGNVHITFNSPLASFVSEFTNQDGSQRGVVWIDVLVDAASMVPFMSQLDLQDGEVIFLVDRDFTLVAASTGSVFRNASAVAWQRADSPFVHPWITSVGRDLISRNLPVSQLPSELKLGGLVVSTLLVDDGRDLVLLVVSVAEERTLLRRLREAQRLTLGLGGALLGASIVLAAVLSWLVTRPLGRLVGVLGLVAEMRLDEIPPEAERTESRLLEVKLLQAVLFNAVARLREYKLYMPTTLFAAEKDVVGDMGEETEQRPSAVSPSADGEASLHNSSQPTMHSSHRTNTNTGKDARRDASSAAFALALGLSARSGTVMVCDVAGFHAMPGTIPLADVVAMHGRYITAILPAVRESRGVADGFVGDHVVASWNTQIPIATHRSAACHAALEIQVRLRASTGPGEGIVVRLAVASGRVYFGNLGSAERRAFSIIGPAVVTATAISKALDAPMSKPNANAGAALGGGPAAASGSANVARVVLGVGGSVALEQRAYFYFSPVAICRLPVTVQGKDPQQPQPDFATTVVYGVRGAAGGTANGNSGNNEWMYELQQIDNANKPEVWALLQYIEANNRAAAARTFPTAAPHLPVEFAAQAEQYIATNDNTNNSHNSHTMPKRNSYTTQPNTSVQVTVL